MQHYRNITFVEAINETLDQLLETDKDVFLIGEGVPDPKCIFGTTKGLAEKYGEDRVMDMPVAENGMTGIIIGAAVTGMKPILVHQRIDFSLYALDQVINNAAKWYSMFGGQKSCPLVIRVIIGKGWGQGNQHSQNLQTLYAHIPGLKVIAPSNAFEAKGMLVSAVKDPNPVIFIEHRWLHNTSSNVPEDLYEIPLEKSHVVKEGKDITLVAWSNMIQETLKANEYLEKDGINAEIINIRSLSPFDFDPIKDSVNKTGKIIVADSSWKHNGLAGEILARVIEDEEIDSNVKAKRITFPDFPSPSTPALCQYYYPTFMDIYKSAHQMLDSEMSCFDEAMSYLDSRTLDVPDRNFTGPF